MSRGALDLLLAYNDDDLSEDDIVPGPKVSTKRSHRSDSEDEENPNKSKLPIPSQFKQQMNSQNENLGSQHNGKIRSFAHERGNWATFVYIPFSSNYGIEELVEALQTYLSKIELNPVDDFHISLTKTLVLKYHWIESFKSTISNKIKGIRRFIIMFDALQIYCNEERTRTFIGLKINTGYDSLLNITHALDRCLQEYKLDTFYKEASFHMSVLWCLGDKVNELMNCLPVMNEIFNKICNNTDSTCWYITVDSVYCKTGNKCFTFSI